MKFLKWLLNGFLSNFFVALILLNSEFILSKEKREVTIIGEDDWYPYSAKSKKGNELHGMAVDLVKAAYEVLGHKVRLESMPYARCMLVTASGKEIGCFDTLKDATTTKTHTFGSQPLFSAAIKIYSRKENTERNLNVKNLENKIVGVTNGYTYGDEFEVNKLITKEIALTDRDNLKKLMMKRFDYVVIYETIFHYLLSENIKFRNLFTEVGSVGLLDLYVSFSKKHPEAPFWRDQLDIGLQKIRNNGEYNKIEQSWKNKLMK